MAWGSTPRVLGGRAPGLEPSLRSTWAAPGAPKFRKSVARRARCDFTHVEKTGAGGSHKKAKIAPLHTVPHPPREAVHWDALVRRLRCRNWTIYTVRLSPSIDRAMSEPRRHHLVPQMHLKRFADHKRRIVMLSRDQKKRISTDIKNACVQTDYYAVETDDGRSQEVEKFLSNIESGASAAIEEMINGKFPLSNKDRAAVALFIGFQCLRGDEAREGYEQITDMLAKMMLANTPRQRIIETFRKQKGRDPTEEELTTERQLLRKMSSLEGIAFTPDQNANVQNMLKLAPEIADNMLQRCWLLFDHSEPCLLTSDTPVVKWSKPTGPGAKSGRGWNTADEIQMPLSLRHSLALVKNHTFRDSAFNLGRKRGPELGAEMNKLVAYSARRWIFHHPDMDPLKGVILAPSGPIFTIEGNTGRIIPEDW